MWQDEITHLQAGIIRDSDREAAREMARETDRDNIYVFADDDDEARAFDDFYGAYDEGHAKTRKFLLG